MYKIKEVAEILNVSDRTVQRYLNSYFSLEKGAYVVSEKMLNILKKEHLEDESEDVVELFTKDEYQEFHKRLSEYPLLKDQIEYLKKDILYHRKSIESHNRQMELLLLSATNKKFIDDEN